MIINCTLWQMCGCENNDTEWNDINWVLSDWEDFDWFSVWDEFDLSNAIDWNNIPWDEIIDLNLIPDDLLDYLISMVSSGQPFNWNSFLSAQSCNDDDTTVSIGLSIWTDVSGCADALVYINSLGYNCFTELNMPFVSADNITLFELCCETCENANGGGDDIEGCTDDTACNYNSYATVDDGSCLFNDCNGDCGGTAVEDCNGVCDGTSVDNDAAIAAELGLLGINDCSVLVEYVMANYGYTLNETCAWDGTTSPLGSFGYTIASVCQCSCPVPVLGCTNPASDNSLTILLFLDIQITFLNPDSLKLLKIFKNKYFELSAKRWPNQPPIMICLSDFGIKKETNSIKKFLIILNKLSAFINRITFLNFCKISYFLNSIIVNNLHTLA